jgi:hypothetical protein
MQNKNKIKKIIQWCLILTTTVLSGCLYTNTRISSGGYYSYYDRPSYYREYPIYQPPRRFYYKPTPRFRQNPPIHKYHYNRRIKKHKKYRN